MTGDDDGTSSADRPGQRWDVALSFAGAQREYVGQVAAALKARGVRCFYDADEQVRLWGTHLAEELPRIYARQSAAVVVFVSADYAAGDWTRLERRAAFSRAVAEAGVYVLPARFDDSELDGLLPDVVYIDLRRCSPGQFAALVVEKLADLDIRLPLVPGGGQAGKTDLWRLGATAAIRVPDDMQAGYMPLYAGAMREEPADRPDDRNYRRMCQKYLEWAANEWRYIDLGDLGAEPDALDSDRVRMLPLQKMYISLQADPRSVADRQRQESLRQMDEDELDIDVARRMSRQENLDAILARGPEAPAGENAGRAASASPGEAGILLEDAFARHPVLVVLGGPGSGKSVLCLWLGREVARETREALAHGGTGRIRIPMLFRAADYAKSYERELASGGPPGGVGRFLAAMLHAAVGYPGRMLQGMFERALADREAVLLIDGLDELTDHRNEVIDALAAVVEAHVGGAGGGDSQAVITSRVAGYDDVYLTIPEAAHYLIRPMTDDQASTFVQRFFTELKAADQAPLLLRHLADSTSDVVRRLATTPLLLTSMCSYWYRHHELPASRPALYRQLLLDTAFRWRGFATSLAARLVSLPVRLSQSAQIHGGGSAELRVDGSRCQGRGAVVQQ